MRGLPPNPELDVGGIYRDVDGSLVQMLALQGDVCCWTPLGSNRDAAQMTHRDNFLRRFTAVSHARHPRRKQVVRRALAGVISAKSA